MYTGIWCFQRRYAKFSKKIFKKFVDVDRFFMMSTGLSSYYIKKKLISLFLLKNKNIFYVGIYSKQVWESF